MQNPNSPRDSDPKAPSTGDLFAANKAINAQTMAPAQGLGLSVVPTYRPSGKIGALALPLWLLSLLVVPVTCALLYENLWHFGRLMIFSQMFLGALAGGLLYPAVQWGKVRNTVLAGVLGALIGAATFAGAMALEAWNFRPQYIAGETAYIAQKYKVSPAKARAAAEGFYTPQNTLKFYWLDRAQAGMTMTSSRSRSSSQISGTAFWVVEGLELALVTIIGALIPAQLAARRFSEERNRWYLAKSFGAVHPLNFAPLMAAAQQSDFATVGQLAPGGKQEGGSAAQLNAYYLPEKAGGIVCIKAVANKNKGMQAVFEREVSDAEMRALWPAFPASSAGESPFSS